MPRYRFRWDLVPADVLADVSSWLHIDGEPAVGLDRSFGTRPRADFIRQTWTVLSAGWLHRDGDTRARVVAALRKARLGDRTLDGDDPESELGYLASCRNAGTLRQVVLAEFLALGDRARPGKSEPAGSTRPAGSSSTFDLDAVLDGAWTTYQVELAERLTELDDDEIMVLKLPTPLRKDELVGAVPYLQYRADPGGTLRAEVTSNYYLDPHHRLTAKQERRLAALGWTRPDYDDADEVNFHCDTRRDDAAELAARSVATIREVFDLPHPSFLSQSPGSEEAVELDDDDALASDTPIEVTGPDHLREVADRWLRDVLGEQPRYDDDGDVAIRNGDAIVFVRVRADVAIVEITSPLALDVAGTAVALERLNRLNQELLFAKVMWDAGTVLAVTRVPCRPFVPALLNEALRTMCELADDLDDRPVRELGGRRFFDDPKACATEDSEEDPTQSHPALRTILHLTFDGAQLSADEAAEVCNYDRDLILTLIHDSEVQVISWRDMAEDPEEQNADVCAIEAGEWQQTVDLLRAALRVVVLGG